MTPDVAAGVFAFTWLALAMTLVPGSDTVFVIRSSLRDGWRAGVIAAAGVVCGVVIWGALAGLGVALLLVRFPIAYNAVAIVGGAYLVFLAIRSFVSARRTWRSDDTSNDADATDPPQSLRTVFAAGLLTNLLNPKIGVFYLSVMPGLFLGHTLSLWLGLVLGLIHAAWGIVWLSAVSILANLARRYLLGAKPRAALEAACGVLLLAFGVFVIVEVLIVLT